MEYEESNLKIYVTKDYDQFKLLKENRNLINNKLLERTILERNKLQFNPIIVNKDFYVMDGQHRLEIARKNGLSLYFMIDENYDVMDIQKLNVGRRNWTATQYIDFYAKLGNPNYQIAKYLLETYHISVNAVIRYFCDSVINTSYKDGSLHMKYTMEEAIDIMEKYKDIMDRYRYLLKDRFIPNDHSFAVLSIILNPMYDHERMLYAMDHYVDDFVRAFEFRKIISVRNILINDVYNKHLQKNRIES